MVVFVVFYCFHDQITNQSIQLAQNLTSSNLDVWPEQFHSISDVMFLLGNFASILGTFTFEGETIVTAKLFAPLLLPLMIIDLIDFGRDKINTELELSNGDLIDAMRDVSKNIYISGCCQPWMSGGLI